jgi:hypothetical protein
MSAPGLVIDTPYSFSLTWQASVGRLLLDVSTFSLTVDDLTGPNWPIVTLYPAVWGDLSTAQPGFTLTNLVVTVGV